MLHGVCYLYGNHEMPTLHGTVTFREVRPNYVCYEIDIQGIPDYALYGLRIGETLFPPLAPDEQGRLNVIFCRKYKNTDSFSGGTVTLFRYDQQMPDVHTKHKTVALGTVRKLIYGGENYVNLK